MNKLCTVTASLTHLPFLHRDGRHVDETADKLDCMMDTVFVYLARFVLETAFGSRLALRPRLCSRITSGDADATMQTLLRALQLSLLTTYKSKFTQVRFWRRDGVG